MAHVQQLEGAKYICCCGSLKPICSIYFCRHCLRLRCPYCVSHEVDSHYCGNCSENMPSAEAKQKKNRCGTCYDCPSCRQTLTIRATTIQIPSEADPAKLAVQKLYYLACGFCRWTSRDAGLPDSPSTSGTWQEPESPFSKEIVHMHDYLRVLALREKNSKEKKFVHKSKYLAAGRHGLAHLLPKRYPISTPDEMYKPIPPPEYVAPTKGDDEFQELSDKFFEEEINVPKVTSLEQRLHQLETQPHETSALLPTHKQLLIKRSLRCRVCERNISKPEYSPVSVKFKIQLNAFYHVVQVRMAAPLSQPLNPGGTATILLKLSNPTQFPTSIKFLPFAFVPLSKDDLSSQMGALDVKVDPARESSTDVSLPSNISSPSTSITIIASPSHGGRSALPIFPWTPKGPPSDPRTYFLKHGVHSIGSIILMLKISVNLIIWLFCYLM
ncbi:dynactin subunit 4 isoform X2 [Folsomia candida]|uniref:dynactin subunit 4 isoform X2 n=1 Tax=Folsomia candida TaxID=158441 RepID=UPI001604B186|nr:dynactin subunit 4 isoform X2 [Folsomia candida]